MSYFGSFSNSAFSNEPYGSSRFSTNDSTWTQNQTSSVWAQPPQQQPMQMQQQHSYEQQQPRYVQVFDQQPLSMSSRPLNPMGAATRSSFPQYSYMGGGLSSLSSGFNDNRMNRFDGGRRDNRQWIPQEERRNGGFSRNDNGGRGGRGGYGGGGGRFNDRNGGGRQGNNDRRRNDEYVPRRVSTGASPKQQKNAAANKKSGDYIPSRIAPATPDRREGGGGGGNKKRQDSGRGGARNGGARQNNGGPNTGRRMKPRANKSTDLEFKSIPDGAPSKSFTVKGENLVCFQGLTSVLATQHEFPLVIDGSVYASVDLYYQIEKCRQLTGKECAPLMALVQKEEDFEEKKSKTDSKTYGQLARTFLKENEIDRPLVEEWRREGGVVTTYTAMRAKAAQCAEMRELLHSSVNQIIVHTYAGDAIFGSGTRVQFVHKWADELAKTNAKITIPLEPLSDEKVICMAPQIAEGRNLLGLIHMQLAEEVVKGSLPFEVTAASLHETAKDVDIVDLSKVEEEDELMSV